MTELEIYEAASKRIEAMQIEISLKIEFRRLIYEVLMESLNQTSKKLQTP